MGQKLSDLSQTTNSSLQSTDTFVVVVGASAPYSDKRLPVSEMDLRYAKLASPTLTGTPAAPTASAGTNTTQIATTAFVSTAVANIVNSAPSQLDTLKELADALGDDANYASTVTAALGGKLAVTSNLSDVASASTALSNLGGIASSTINQPNGVAGLDSDGAIVAKIEVLCDTFANISGIALEAGRIAVTSDTLQIFTGVGDSHTGGYLVGTTVGGKACVLVQDSGNNTTNGTNLIAAYAAAKLLTPGGNALSATNPAYVLLMPGTYDVGACSNSDGTFPNYGMKLDGEHIYIVGLGPATRLAPFGSLALATNEAGVVITGTLAGSRSLLTTDGCCLLKITAQDHRLKNLTLVTKAGGSNVTDYTAAGIYFFNNSSMTGAAAWEDVSITAVTTKILACVCAGSSNLGWAGQFRRVYTDQPFFFYSRGSFGSLAPVPLWDECRSTGDNAWNSYGHIYATGTMRRCSRNGAINDIPLISTWTAGGSTTAASITGTAPSVQPSFGLSFEYCSFTNTGAFNADAVYLSTGVSIIGSLFQCAGSSYGYAVNAGSAVSIYGGGNVFQGGLAPNVSNVTDFAQAKVSSRASTTSGDSVLELTALPTPAGTTSVPIGGLANAGEAYEFEYAGTFGANTNNKILRLWFGGATPTSGTKCFDSGTLTNNGDGWRLTGRVIRVDGTHQIIEGAFSTTSGTGNQTFYTTSGRTLTSTNNIELTGNTPTSAGDITLTYSDIRWRKAA